VICHAHTFLFATFSGAGSISSLLKKDQSTEGTGNSVEEYFSLILFSNFRVRFFNNFATNFATNPGQGMALHTLIPIQWDRKGSLMARRRSGNCKEPGHTDK
jgi:hypothetical protein